MNKRGFFLLIFNIILYTQAVGQQFNADKLDSYIQKCVTDWGTPGVSVGIVRDGKVIFSRGFGVITSGKQEKPDGNTLYAIASNTKAFTSMLMAFLVQEGKIGWDDKVKDHLPYFELYDRWVSQEITLRDLLCHRSGLGTFSGDFIWYKSSLTSEEIIRRLPYLPQKFSFRDGYGYSNVMYITAGEVIKQVTGKSWGENVTERILVPLKMDRTIYSPDKLEEKGNFATPHALEEGRNIPIPWTDWEEYAALGGIISSVNDMCQWMIFNMANEPAGKEIHLTPFSRNTLWKVHNPMMVDHTRKNDFNTHFNGYGLGWSLSDYRGRLKVSHGGAFDGMISSVAMIPDEKIGVVVLTNGMMAPTTPITNYVFDALLGLPERDWSSEMLKRQKERDQSDTRISDRMKSQVKGTRPSLPLENYAGKYQADIYGVITVSYENGKLRLGFEHSPELSATLEHWHYDVWKINWDHKHAWFSFGTVKFNLDNNLNVAGMDFDVPNDDIFFEELKPKKLTGK